MADFKIFSGRSNPQLAEAIAATLEQPLGKVEIKNFSDDEIWVKYNENLRGSDVYIIQSTNSPAQNLMELLVMLDAAKRASARRVTPVIPYFGYARQDRKDQPRVAITAKLIANLITAAGADRVITMELHSAQIQGFFDIPVDHLYAGSKIFVPFWQKANISNYKVAALDVGGIKMARYLAKKLNTDLVLIDKKRSGHNEVDGDASKIIGDVKDFNVLTVDDLIDTAGTYCGGVKALKKAGALDIYGTFTHAVCSGEAYKLINELQNSDLVKKIVITNTLQLHDKPPSIVEILNSAPIFAEAIRCAANNLSISQLFETDEIR